MNNPYSIPTFLKAKPEMKLFYHYLEHTSHECGLWIKEYKETFVALGIPPQTIKGVVSELGEGLIVDIDSHLLLPLKSKGKTYFTNKQLDKQCIALLRTHCKDWFETQLALKNVRIKEGVILEGKSDSEKIEDLKGRVVGVQKARIAKGEEAYPIAMVNRFIEYWTTIPDNTTKMLFEMKDTFSTGSRLSTFYRNWNKNGG